MLPTHLHKFFRAFEAAVAAAGLPIPHCFPADINISRQTAQTNLEGSGESRKSRRSFRFQLPASPAEPEHHAGASPSSVTLRHACLPHPASRTRCLEPTQRDVTCPHTQQRGLEIQLIRQSETHRSG